MSSDRQTTVFGVPREAGVKLSAAEKVARIPIKVLPTETSLPKPDWIRVRMVAEPRVMRIKKMLRRLRLHTVCEEASCPNLNECFGGGTATFMIMGDICTRRCPFCDVGYGRPAPLDEEEPAHLAQAIAQLSLRYVVITSVDRDDLSDGGAGHFAECIQAVRREVADIEIETLVPDFRGRMDVAIDLLGGMPPDVFNHNLETVPRLYRQVRPGSDYAGSLRLLRHFKQRCPEVPTKSGIMLGLGEEMMEVERLLLDLREHGVNMVTLGQYLQPTRSHLPVTRYVPPAEFDYYAMLGGRMGFDNVASGPLVRSSYHADKQHKGRAVA